ncbi:hypothetical protein A2526_03955 [candidate division WOR-1 bacterium RIFOXYD2_FULL_36_8]|uniref:Uncharacterized protein n=1 Tax=candidate division WOR-1 bacterium RIFOXYB2_FULL_36_35 TaxID=1802578 RepID=A0A1F4RZ65_UNCSA|nr:MAG: hypothetical protein A2230_07205 [candidate division WOR-1 bacterium RIFOXYA2_FULL_36_21]OGC12753.1 MAG: hypothetical protein A2290_01035 [candidate division WOR-1 bacterium RIFOXYB2_FULL_36_35]OGC19788.1 MAG: hypothetical protein A2282_00955 [candidate division WOR-1 bacterium RIFOXYA12_FULL_36_13]OGC39077.1 MAG: hypothetical protein A2526_03955 [candidate division WOR-1 bacterium RIFOXYD2_FULL_36_8]
MKAVFIIFSAPLELLVLGALKNLQVKFYTKLPYLLGEGGESEPHLDTQIWPGFNMGLFVVTDEKTKDRILNEVKSIKASYLKEGIKAYVIPVSEEV